MRKYVRVLLPLLVALFIVSCNEKKEIRFRANYFMGIDTLKITLKDDLKNVLLDTVVDTKHNINVSINSFIILGRHADSLKILVNNVDTSLEIQSIPQKAIDIAYTNMFYGIKDTILYGPRYERVIVNLANFKPYE